MPLGMELAHRQCRASDVPVRLPVPCGLSPPPYPNLHPIMPQLLALGFHLCEKVLNITHPTQPMNFEFLCF